METPTPVDLNKLKSILGNAKKLMKVTDEKFTPKKQSGLNESNYSSSIYDERDEREPTYQTPNMSDYSPTQNVRDYTEEDVINSKLPDVIKEAMLKNPIPKASMSFSKFTLDGLEDLIEKPSQKSTIKTPSIPLRESSATYEGSKTNMVNISEAKLNELIDKRVSEVLANMFVKTLSEETIKRTIGTLIKEGKLNTKK
jgi:hypothetical protein